MKPTITAGLPIRFHDEVNMKLPNPLLALAALALAASLGGCATSAIAPRNAHIKVDWSDPVNFTDTRSNLCRNRAKPEEWLSQLARYVENRADRVVAGGKTLKVTITDIQRAGQCEPWRGPNLDDTRIIKDIYPPSISLHFQHTDASGHVVDEGDRTLRDSAFMHRGTMLNQDDPLRFEKRLLDDWLRKEFANVR